MRFYRVEYTQDGRVQLTGLMTKKSAEAIAVYRKGVVVFDEQEAMQNRNYRKAHA